MTRSQYPAISARPVKSFFVTMLTRDISLSDAILDLLDNCVDGILRHTEGKARGERPYEGYWAHIDFDKDTFTITDNCGGIPAEQRGYAFRLGRADPDQDRGLPTVGAYGIGMKRAIFKLGRQALISTQHGKDCYEVAISPEWIGQDDNWDLQVAPGSFRPKKGGTCIVVGNLYEGIAEQFGGEQREVFTSEFTKKVATHYAFIINKGFEIKVNKKKVEQRPTELVFMSGNGAKSAGRMLRPFLYKAEVGGVKVFLAVGLTRQIPSDEEVRRESEVKKYSSLDAGWTVVCNDRCVVYCDLSELTGWGEAGVPRYHTQFIAISGVVEFVSNDPSELPMTTTKRGLDSSSRVYLQVKNKMREGMKIFTDFTNRWKGRTEEARRFVEAGERLSLPALKEAVTRREVKMTAVRSGGQQSLPRLPVPIEAARKTERISFWKKREDIRDVARYLTGSPDTAPSKVGERCFDEFLKEVHE